MLCGHGVPCPAVQNVPASSEGGADLSKLQGGSNMTGTDLYVNKPHCAAAVRP